MRTYPHEAILVHNWQEVPPGYQKVTAIKEVEAGLYVKCSNGELYPKASVIPVEYADRAKAIVAARAKQRQDLLDSMKQVYELLNDIAR